MRSDVVPLNACARSCALSPDGSLAVAGFDDGGLKVVTYICRFLQTTVPMSIPCTAFLIVYYTNICMCESAPFALFNFYFIDRSYAFPIKSSLIVTFIMVWAKCVCIMYNFKCSR